MERRDDPAEAKHAKVAASSDAAIYTRLTDDGIGLLVVEPRADGAATTTSRRDLHVVFILDRSGSMAGAFRRVVLPACAGYLDVVRPQHASAIFFNDKAKTFPHVTSAWFRASTKDGKWTTRIDRGVEAAVQFVLKDAHGHHDAERPVYQFVFMTDGVNDAERTGDLLKVSIYASASRLSKAGCDSFVSVINVTAAADTRAGMWTHSALSTMSVSAEGAFAVAHTATDVEPVIASLAAHTTAVVGSGVGRLRTISFGAHESGGRDATDLTASGSLRAVTLAGTAPQSTVRVAGDRIAVLVRGPPGPPSHVTIDGFVTPVSIVDRLDLDTATLVLETVDDHATRVAMAQVSGRNGLNAMDAVALLGAVLDSVDASGALNKGALARLSGARTPYERVRLMRRTMEASRGRVASIRSTQLVAQAAASDMAAYVNDMSRAKYGVAALRRAAASHQTPHDPKSILAALARPHPKAGATAQGDFVSASHKAADDHEAPVSFISQQTADELWTEATLPDEHDRVRAAAGGADGLDEHMILSAFGMLGYGIETYRPASCVVEPWHLSVRYVSCDIVGTNDLICALATNTLVEDLSRRRITDAVVVRDPAHPAPYDAYARSPLAAVYLGVVCARNPSVVLTSQATAVPALAMMRAAAQVAGHHGRDTMTCAHAAVLLRLVLHVAHIVKTNDRAAHIASSLAGTAEGSSVCGSVLTTKSHVHRIAQALAYMVARSETATLVQSPDRLAAVARAMLAQAIVEAAAAASSKHASAACTLADIVSGKGMGSCIAHAGDSDGDDQGDSPRVTLQEAGGTCDAKDRDDGDDDAKHHDDDHTIDALETMLAIAGDYPVPLADSEREPNDIAFGGDYDETAAVATGRACLNWLSNGAPSVKSPIVDVLVGVALARAMYERVAPAAIHAGHHAPLAFDAISAFVASSADGEQTCARLVAEGLKDSRAMDTVSFIRSYWNIDVQSSDSDDVALCVAALAAQALQRPTASRRCNDPDTGAPQLEPLDSVNACRAYLAATAARVRTTRYQQLLSTKNARLREAERQRREAEAAAERERLRAAWRDAHVGMPMVFTVAQVEAHNLAHPDDPWTMSKHPKTGRPSGLLADRCCFASCPESMKRLGNAGLWEHLAPGQCTPAFHVAAREAFAQLAGDYAAGRSRAEILADFTHTIKAALSEREINEVVPDMYSVTLAEFERAYGRSAVVP
ncbi:Von Willebrand factor type A domain containing protein [Pandoravirus neocaledonia]|uniref:von Willebrand factor type A domain containing protein n=1 Tax=Pandoravirus neocaledonia TaxID=2107708 RepID=A0A2U7UB48_9VIRU|nr:Von Willebrand factor type A domain containing protein [Pandoravirus neocaledonia]AVK75669.1 Von Willebrand factor type A domain containing protein [Pandoravirus neocaledonia]